MPDEAPRRRTAWKRSHIRGEPDFPDEAQRAADTAQPVDARGRAAEPGSPTSIRGDEGRDAPAPRTEAGADVGRGSRAGGQNPETQGRVWREATEREREREREE